MLLITLWLKWTGRKEMKLKVLSGETQVIMAQVQFTVHVTTHQSMAEEDWKKRNKVD